MLSLVSGHYPANPGQVAVTGGVASAFHLKVGDGWHQGGRTRTVTGIVENPQSLLDEFALVVPGQVSAPTQVSVLFDAPGASPNSLGPNVQTVSAAVSPNALNPESISIAALTVGMLLITLVAVGGFTVLAQRRLRSLGMLASLGATDSRVRMVVRANGVIVGVIGAVTGAVVGLAAWLAYRPLLETSAHHVIGVFSLPWLVIVLALVLAVVAAFVAASRPARAITRIPVVTALSGRPAPPKRVRRSAIPGLVLLVAAFALLTISPGSGQGAKGNRLELILGLVTLIGAVILLCPMCLAVLGRIGRHAPIAVRLALRDLSRYRARSGSALAAISLGVLAAVIISVASAARYANVLDYAGPNLAPNQLIIYTPNGPYGQNGPGSGSGTAVTGSKLRSMAASARGLAAALGSHDMVQLDSTSATLQHAASGRNWSGPVFGIKPSQVDPTADILTMRPGLSGLSGMQIVYGRYYTSGTGPLTHNGHETFPCPRSDCLAGPRIQEVSGLPPGTSAPNTVITEHAVRRLGLRAITSGWLIQTPHALTAAQFSSARRTAAAAGMSVETRSSVPTSAEITNWATAFGIVLALAILAMAVGLLRSETASDLRTLTATGAGPMTRRNLTAVTAGALALIGALLGTAAGYVASIAWFRGSALNGGVGALANAPVGDLLFIVVGMPLIAVAVGWLLAGREPPAIAHQPIE